MKIKKFASKIQAMMLIVAMITIPFISIDMERQNNSGLLQINTSQNYGNIDDLNITNINIKYDSGDYFMYETYGYFLDTAPFATSETSIVSIEYLNFSSSDNESLVNGTEYTTQPFNATIYDGVSPPDIMILPESNYIITDLRETFLIRYKIPVMIYNDTGIPSTNITVRVVAFNNASDKISLNDDSYAVTYDLKTNLFINSMHFSKENIVVKIDGLHVNPYDFRVSSPVFDLEIYDMEYNLIYHNMAVRWSQNIIVDFTSAKITNAFYTSVLASIAPVSTVDQAFYQKDVSDYDSRDNRFIQEGSFEHLYQGSNHLVFGYDQAITLPTPFPTDSPVRREWQYNVYDANEITMPVSMNYNSSDFEYPAFLYFLGTLLQAEMVSYWIYTPETSNETIISTLYNDGVVSTNLNQGLAFMYGFHNGSIWDLTNYMADNSSLANCTRIANVTGNTWYHIAVVSGNSTQNASVYLNFNKIYDLNYSLELKNITPFFVFNHTTTNSLAFNGTTTVGFSKNNDTSVDISFNLANLWYRGQVDNNRVDNIIINGQSTISYFNSTAFSWDSIGKGGYYHALTMRYDTTVLQDFMDFMYLPDGISIINDTLIDGDFDNGFNFRNARFEDVQGHSKAMVLDDNSDFNLNIGATSGIVQWGGLVGQYENSTFEMWINTKDGNGNESVIINSPSGDQIYVSFNRHTSYAFALFYDFNQGYIFNQSFAFFNETWNHLRIDLRRTNGTTNNATTFIYLNGNQVVNFSLAKDCSYQNLQFVSGITNLTRIYVDAIGYWRSSWIGNPNYDDFYEIGDNLNIINATYSDGTYTFDDVAVGSGLDSISPYFKGDHRNNDNFDDGSVIYYDDVRGNVYNLTNTKSISSFLGIPIYEKNFHIMPNGNGYETRGRVSFWFYVNGSKPAAKFSFIIYDDGGTKVYVDDDSAHGFVIGNGLDNSNVSSRILYFKKINGINYFKNSGFALQNDTWNYFVFEWNSTSNCLCINQENVFYGDIVKYSDTDTIVESSYSQDSYWSLAWASLYNQRAIFFLTGIYYYPEQQILPSTSDRTAFIFGSIPSVDFQTPLTSAGAVWKSSEGYIDNLNFEEDITVPHDYRPAMISIPLTQSNFTIYSSLSRTYPLSSWNDISLYQGAFYNVTFIANSTNTSYPIQVFCDGIQYIVFTTPQERVFSILHPIDVTRTDFKVKLWSINGSYTLRNFTVTLTSRFPQLIDSFKKYMDDYAIFSRYIGMNSYTITNITAGMYYLLASSVPNADVAYFDYFNVTNGANDADVLPPSLRRIMIFYTDQRGNPVTNVRTYLHVGDTFQLQPMNGFQAEIQAEIGTTIEILSKNVFDEIVYLGSYTVLSDSNYINVITVVHSLMIYNQDEHFINYTITKAFAPGFYWSRYLYPKTGVEEKLTSGNYNIIIRDYLGSTTSYNFNIFGDDYLLVDSDFTIENAINNIKNVNTTIGNQITSVELNITNQNSQINNSIVSVEINLSNINSTLGTQLLSLDASIISVNSTINEQTTYIATLIGNINSTIFEQSTYITSLIANVNASIDNQTTIITSYFTNINSSITNQFLTVTSLLVAINNTINNAEVNLTQGFFTDLTNGQTANLTGNILQIVNNQTNYIEFQINELSGLLINETLNLEYQIYNQTIELNGTFNLQFNELTSSNQEIRELIRTTDFSAFVNWSNSVEILGIVEMKILNPYNIPVIVELVYKGLQINYTIYSNDYISEYVPSGLYQYRIRNLYTDAFLPRFENETADQASIFISIYIDNSSRTITTTFATVNVPTVPQELSATLTGFIIVIIAIGAGMAFLIYTQVKRRKDGRKKMDGNTNTVNKKPEHGKSGAKCPVIRGSVQTKTRTSQRRGGKNVKNGIL